MGFYLSIKEVWRNKVRFFLFSLVIALITTLVLFIAALAEGLALSNKEYLSKLDAELIVFQDNVDLSAATSRIGRSKLNDMRRVEGVKDLGSLGFGSATIVFADGREPLDISLIGVEIGKPGSPPVLSGRDLRTSYADEVIIDANVVSESGVKVGDEIIIKSIQGTDEEYFNLKVVGITEGQQYLFAPSIFVPYRTWDQVRSQASKGGSLVELTSNVVVVKVDDPEFAALVAKSLVEQVDSIEVVDPQTAIESIPGYAAQQSTLNTQQGFTLLIGILVIGGFFQIQMLQKVPQIGVLKAIGASNVAVAISVIVQIIIVTSFGVLLGALIALGLAQALPQGIPIVFNGQSVLIAIASLLAIGPLGGLVSVRLAVSVEPLTALGLSS